MGPSLETVAMAVYAVLHDMTSMYLSTLVNLPEDDVATTGCTNEVVLIYAKQLF